MALLYLLGSGICRVDKATFDEFVQNFLVDVHALGLTVRLVRATDIDAFIPAQPKPGQGINDGLVGLFRVTGGIGVLDAKYQLATGMAGIGPVE